MPSMWWLEVLAVVVMFISVESAIPQLFRRIHKTGFHREVHTSVKWSVKPLNKSDVQKCVMMLVEQFPPGLYVDPFQLHNMLQFNGPKVLVYGPVDIEKPEHISGEITLNVYTDLPVVRHDNEGCTLSGSATIPVHLRYHHPAYDTAYATVVIPNPKFYTNCTLKDSASLLQAPCDHTNTSQCLWHEFLYQADKERLVCSVPVGNMSHLPYIVSITLLVTCGGCVFIMYIVFRTKEKKVKVS